MKRLVAIAILVLFANASWAQTSLPTGTALKMKLETTLATFSNHAGDPFQARVTEPEQRKRMTEPDLLVHCDALVPAESA